MLSKKVRNQKVEYYNFALRFVWVGKLVCRMVGRTNIGAFENRAEDNIGT